jgi:membrane-bound lytic murein transglycosylase B
MKFRLLFPLFFLLLFASFGVRAADTPELTAFITEMVEKHGFDRYELERTFQQVQRRQTIVDAITRPVTTPTPWADYRGNFVNPKSIKNGLIFWQTHADTLQRAEQQYGVPQEIIVALIGVETRYGTNTGKFKTLEALTTLAFDYPRRADFFRGELEQYLLLAREQKMDALTVRSSYAGALGIPQFMPSSYRKYAVDFDGDGRIDLLGSPADAIGSVANYLNQYGWSKGTAIALRGRLLEGVDGEVLQPEARSLSAWARAGVVPLEASAESGFARLVKFNLPDEGKEYWLAFTNFDVIMKYNHSYFYAMAVTQLGEALKAEKREGEFRAKP